MARGIFNLNIRRLDRRKGVGINMCVVSAYESCGSRPNEDRMVARGIRSSEPSDDRMVARGIRSSEPSDDRMVARGIRSSEVRICCSTGRQCRGASWERTRRASSCLHHPAHPHKFDLQIGLKCSDCTRRDRHRMPVSQNGTKNMGPLDLRQLKVKTWSEQCSAVKHDARWSLKRT
jgi:hypothetical protein